MNFEEMKKIWDSQNNEPLYVINEEAMHRSVRSKKKKASQVVNVTEIGLMIINSLTGVILIADAILDKEGFWDYAGAVVMLLTVVYLYFIRKRRIREEKRFDRSILGEINHAISSTTSTIRLGTTMLWWYLLPITFFVFGKMAYFGSSLEKWLLIIGMLALSNFLVNWEIRKIHKPRRSRLESLKAKLLEEI